MNLPNIFNWDRIGRALKKGRGPEKMPLQSTFDEIATAYFKEVIWKDKKVSLHDQLRDYREMLEHSEYAWADVPTEDDHTSETAKTENIMLVEVAVRRTFFRLCQSWIKERMETAGVSEGTGNPGVLEGTESHPGKRC
ncbi:uncharacterized protein QC763_508077 [Podospora pseudopauciseta]|uniref:Uncharacterized protein n=1 Tax=Podospora pseudopauciseta TaxID=2093780 RepID=A0ABR0HAC5_9PEZI|nr:hypothetical protein QC763_508077 [Podospora pseudopauciseta]